MQLQRDEVQYCLKWQVISLEEVRLPEAAIHLAVPKIRISLAISYTFCTDCPTPLAHRSVFLILDILLFLFLYLCPCLAIQLPFPECLSQLTLAQILATCATFLTFLAMRHN